MKTMHLGLLAVLMIIASNSFSSEPSSECPQGFEGQWLCHNISSNEMTETPVKAIKRGNRIYSYTFAGDEWSLSRKWARIMSTTENGINVMMWLKNRCQAGVIISHYKFIDSKGNMVGPVYSYETKMDNVDQFSISNSDYTINHICKRQ